MPAGVYITNKKDGTKYYRASFTFKNKHISLGSFEDIKKASLVYQEACLIMSDAVHHWIDANAQITSYDKHILNISFEKYISLINYRDNEIYIKTPIYLTKKYFLYFLDSNTVLTFSTDDLFYYSTHKIIRRGGYYYVNDLGIQTSILSRYGIHHHSVKGRDYIFSNNDDTDYRYENIYVINRYNGVIRIEKDGLVKYRTTIHINGNYIVGDYPDEKTAAIAYNKAIDVLQNKISITYEKNYLEDINSISYAAAYTAIQFSKRFNNYIKRLGDDTVTHEVIRKQI